MPVLRDENGGPDPFSVCPDHGVGGLEAHLRANSLNWGGFKCLRVSRNIVRGIWIDTLGERAAIVSISLRQDGFGRSEKAKTKILVSSTKRIFFSPKFFARLA